MRTRLALLTALLFALPAAGASADERVYSTEPAPAAWQQAALQASGAWDQSPDCASGVQILTMTDKPTVGAAAQTPGCVIWINTTQIAKDPPPMTKCKLMTHEWGHLLGFEHTGSGIMAPDASIYDVAVPACDALEGPPPPPPAPRPAPALKPAPATTRTFAAPTTREPATTPHRYPNVTLRVREVRRAIVFRLGADWTIRSCKRQSRRVIGCRAVQRRTGRSRAVTVRGTAAHGTEVALAGRSGAPAGR